MQNASWQDLADFINTQMTEEQKNDCVTILINGEFYALKEVSSLDTGGVLDEDHCYIVPLL